MHFRSFQADCTGACMACMYHVYGTYLCHSQSHACDDLLPAPRGSCSPGRSTLLASCTQTDNNYYACSHGVMTYARMAQAFVMYNDCWDILPKHDVTEFVKKRQLLSQAASLSQARDSSWARSSCEARHTSATQTVSRVCRI